MRVLESVNEKKKQEELCKYIIYTIAIHCVGVLGAVLVSGSNPTV